MTVLEVKSIQILACEPQSLILPWAIPKLNLHSIFFLFCWKLWQIRNSLVTTRNKSDQSIREDLGAFSTLRLLLNLLGGGWCHQREVTPGQSLCKWWVCHECTPCFLIADCLVEGSWFSKVQDKENAIMYHLKFYFPFSLFFIGGGLLLVVMKYWCFKIKINHYCWFFQWSCDGAYTLNMNKYMYWKIEGDDFVEDVCVTFN